MALRSKSKAIFKESCYALISNLNGPLAEGWGLRGLLWFHGSLRMEGDRLPRFSLISRLARADWHLVLVQNYPWRCFQDGFISCLPLGSHVTLGKSVQFHEYG